MRRLICAPRLPIVLPLLLALSCASQQKPDTPARAGPPAAARLELPAIAVKSVDAGAEVDTMQATTAFAAAVSHASGVGTVDENEVKAALEGGCPSPPCQTDETAAYANANIVVTASVMRAGEQWLANGRALEGASVLGRATASAKDAESAIQKVGWELGTALHEQLGDRAPAASPAAAPPSGGDK